MSRLSIRRSHALSEPEARARVARIARELTRRYGAACRWQGAVLLIEHANVRGSVSIEAAAISIEAELGLALSLFRGRAEQEISRILERELEA
jgi:putative polyhydroxyalkanoate system protein